MIGLRGFGRFCAVLGCVVALGAATGLASEPYSGAQYFDTGAGTVAPVSELALALHSSDVVRTDEPFKTALIADPEIADVVPLGDRALYVVGKGVGRTRLIIVDDDQQTVAVIEVAVEADLTTLRARLAEVAPSEAVTVSAVGDGVLLTGLVRDGDLQRQILAVAERYAPEKVINGLKVASNQQVMMEVRFVEATRSASRELGISQRIRGDADFNADIGGQAIVDNVGNILSSALVSGAAPFGTAIATLLDNGTEIDLIIRALEERRLARRLAEPNLMALSGDTASFLAGGEFPFPVGADNNTITIEFKQFGVSLAFTPTVLGDGRINLKIIPEVSEIDPTTSVQIGGVTVPGLVVRRADTTIELNDGQSFAIAGLLQHTNVRNAQQLPWLGNVPVLGPLFRSAEYLKEETDLVIIVTPRLVQPKVPGWRLETPLDSSRPTNDVDFFLLSKAELPRRNARRHRPNLAHGHILTLSHAGAHHANK